MAAIPKTLTVKINLSNFSKKVQGFAKAVIDNFLTQISSLERPFKVPLLNHTQAGVKSGLNRPCSREESN